jgi:transposase-like protein
VGDPVPRPPIGDRAYPFREAPEGSTSLQSWFYAIYLFVTTRHGVSGKELQRTLGVTYKTAWRMGQQIRDLMGAVDGFAMLQGHVELDEAYVGGRRPGKRGRGAAGKTIVMGLKERDGRLSTEVIPNVKKDTLQAVVRANVERGAIVSTDELYSYGLLEADGYKHGAVKHGAKEWSYYDYQHGATHHTNHVESFWRLFKASVRSTHVHVSSQHMQRYLNEFAFRSNHRKMQNAMFDLLISRV